MKKTVMILLVLLAFYQSEAQFTKATLQASGLTCSMCNNAIYKALKKLPFVETVESDIKHSSFDIAFKNAQPADIDAIKDAVEDAGFSVASFKLTGNFDHVNVANDQCVAIGDRRFHFLNVKDQVLNGQQTLTVIDKDFLTVKNFKKFSADVKKDCAIAEGVDKSTKIYHVTI
jgi:copper chaperone CopZ